MPGRQSHELVTLAEQKRIGADNQTIDSLLDDGCKSRINFPFGACVQNIDLKAKRLRNALHIARLDCAGAVVRIDEYRNRGGFGRELADKLQPLRSQCRKRKGYAGDIAAGPVEALYKAKFDWIASGGENDWDLGRCRPGCQS